MLIALAIGTNYIMSGKIIKTGEVFSIPAAVFISMMVITYLQEVDRGSAQEGEKN
jgi:hypothetical protein